MIIDGVIVYVGGFNTETNSVAIVQCEIILISFVRSYVEIEMVWIGLQSAHELNCSETCAIHPLSKEVF